MLGVTILSPLHILQKKFVRLATNNDQRNFLTYQREHTFRLFRDFKILTIYDIFKLQLGTFIYESINNIGPSSNIIRFTRTNEIHSHNTRYAHIESFFKTMVGQQDMA